MPHPPPSLRPLPPSTPPASSSSSSSSSSSAAGMFKNQLQELAQRSCFNLPSYSCIREGPDHAPRFKATVSFNGEVFESPGYHTTLRQAEHAAAEVALSTLSKRGPTQSLAARILDETGVCKNLLQETAQRSGVSLPVYTTIRSGPKHLPLFKCMVEVGGRRFMGDPAKTKKQAEKNAALAAWSSLKQPVSHASNLHDCPDEDDGVDTVANFSSSARARSGKAVGNVRDRGKTAVGRDWSSGNQYQLHQQQGVASLGDVTSEAVPRYVYAQPSQILDETAQQRSAAAGRGSYGMQTFSNNKGLRPGVRQGGGRHQRRHSLSGMESPANPQDMMVLASSMASGGGGLYSGNSSSRLYHHPHLHPHHRQHQRIRGLPYQSLSDRFELNRSSLLEELQQRDEEEDRMMLRNEPSATGAGRPQHLRSRMQSQSERFDYAATYLPQLEEDCGGANAEDWCQVMALPPSTGGFSNNGSTIKEREDVMSGYKEGWLRGEALLQRLEEQKRFGYKEGWLRGGMLMIEKKNEGMQESQVNNMKQLQNSNGGAAVSERMQGILGYRQEAPQMVVDEETVYSAVAAAAAVAATSSPQSTSSSSLWSKSAQWWGSRIAPLSPSSAAAALANTLGLRQASSVAPAVRVRRMVPVCSAPPARRSTGVNEAAQRLPTLHNHLQGETAAAPLESVDGLGHFFNRLRM